MDDNHVVALIAAVLLAAENISAETYECARATAKDGYDWSYREGMSDEVAILSARNLLKLAQGGE